VLRTYTKVVFAIDLLENLGVAVKIIKNQKHFHEQAKTEIDLLSKFLKVPLPSSAQSEVPSSVYNHGRYLPCTQWVEFANIVRLLDTFTFRNHHCLVYLSLSISLFFSPYVFELHICIGLSAPHTHTHTHTYTHTRVYLRIYIRMQYIHTGLRALTPVALRSFEAV
jgi:serine/threonine protein kinase